MFREIIDSYQLQKKYRILKKTILSPYDIH